MGGRQRGQKEVIFDRNRQKAFRYVRKTTSSTFCSKWMGNLENPEKVMDNLFGNYHSIQRPKKDMAYKNSKSSEQDQF